MSQNETVTDMFCGAGGSSTGLMQVPGLEVTLAMNHWERAIETHGHNHPETDHACADVSHIRPEYIPRTTMLWGSPECTNHSPAKGIKRATNQGALFGELVPDEAAERSRATMWDIPRFAEIHKYEVIMTENVVEVTAWLPFNSWLMSMESLGYDHHILSLNSMHSQYAGPGAPQSRDRVYIVFWKKGNSRPDFEKLRPFADCSMHGRVQAIQWFKDNNRHAGKYRQQYVYRCPRHECRNEIVEPAVRPAADAIDWNLKGKRLGDRPKPLAAKTMARIEAGLARYPNAKELLVEYYGNGGSRLATTPFSTFTGKDCHALIVPLRRNATAKTLDKPLDTITGGGNHHTLIEYTTLDIDEVEFRMIRPHEQAWGMDFPRDYKILGTLTEQTLQAGNAVTPPVARDLGTIAVESLRAA